jgi:hypothetical protein
MGSSLIFELENEATSNPDTYIQIVLPADMLSNY